jgi:glycosyltransferase involved in cell wall biosynthesis
MAKKPEISVVMPAYNEGQRIGESLRATHKVMKKMGRPFEIVVVDDGSGDWTHEEARKAAKTLSGVKVKRSEVNQGKGWALKEGFRLTSGQWVVFLDSDLDIDPAQLSLFFAIQKREKVDVVIGSKRHPDTKLTYPPMRRFLSAGYFFLVKTLFGLPLRDTQTGLKLFKAEVLKKAFPKVLIKRYAFDLELLVIAHHYGFSIAEAPVIVNFKGKFGHIGLRAIFNIFWDTAAVFYRLRIRRSYGAGHA